MTNSEKKIKNNNDKLKLNNSIISLISGGLAGISVDIGLFPIDTLKSRLQSGIKSINNKKINIFSGIKSTFLGSFPSAAGFFVTYDYISNQINKKYMNNHKNQMKNDNCNVVYNPFIYMISAICGECIAVLIRNPFELIKQNLQVGNFTSNKEAIMFIYNKYGMKGFYNGYFITVIREIPFSLIQFPLYEYLKSNYIRKAGKDNVTKLQIMSCGALAGGVSAFVTTPIDVIKTRVMTYTGSESSLKSSVLSVVNEINRSNKLLYFSGCHWRVLYISVGGMCFFSTNEFMKKTLGYDNTDIKKT